VPNVSASLIPQPENTVTDTTDKPIAQISQEPEPQKGILCRFFNLKCQKSDSEAPQQAETVQKPVLCVVLGWIPGIHSLVCPPIDDQITDDINLGSDLVSLPYCTPFPTSVPSPSPSTSSSPQVFHQLLGVKLAHAQVAGPVCKSIPKDVNCQRLQNAIEQNSKNREDAEINYEGSKKAYDDAQKQFNEAKSYYDRALNLKPTQPKAIARWYKEMQRWRTAMNRYQKEMDHYAKRIVYYIDEVYNDSILYAAVCADPITQSMRDEILEHDKCLAAIGRNVDPDNLIGFLMKPTVGFTEKRQNGTSHVILKNPITGQSLPPIIRGHGPVTIGVLKDAASAIGTNVCGLLRMMKK
jgi:hypothetical protein